MHMLKSIFLLLYMISLLVGDLFFGLPGLFVVLVVCGVLFLIGSAIELRLKGFLSY
jgi:hypothetical protein